MYQVGQSSPRRRGLGVILGVLLLVAVLVGVFYAFYALVLNHESATPTPTPQMTMTAQVVSATKVATPRPTHTATLARASATVRPTRPPTDTPPQPTATLRPPPEVITIGVRANINISEGLAINLRDLPTLSNSTVITQLVAGAQVDVVDGPEDVGDLRWWSVNGGEGRAGWVVEEYGGQTWLVPVGWTDQLPPLAVPAAPPTPTPAPTSVPATATATAAPQASPTLTPAATAALTPAATPEGGIPSPTVGGRAQVTTRYEFVNLRKEPGLDAETVGQLPNGTIVTILEGPEEADAIRWWKVDAGEGNVGWAAERVGPEVFLVPVP